MMRLRGGVDILSPRLTIAGPRQSESVKLDQVETLILDEADRMLDMDSSGIFVK